MRDGSVVMRSKVLIEAPKKLKKPAVDKEKYPLGHALPSAIYVCRKRMIDALNDAPNKGLRNYPGQTRSEKENNYINTEFLNRAQNVSIEFQAPGSNIPQKVTTSPDNYVTQTSTYESELDDKFPYRG